MHLSTRFRPAARASSSRSRRAQDGLWLRRPCDGLGSEASRSSGILCCPLFRSWWPSGSTPAVLWAAAVFRICTSPSTFSTRHPAQAAADRRGIASQGRYLLRAGASRDDRYQTDLMMKQTFGPRAAPWASRRTGSGLSRAAAMTGQFAERGRRVTEFLNLPFSSSICCFDRIYGRRLSYCTRSDTPGC
ncbi:hypothetical protein HDV57DRAFT_499749 [Trichoderma longibrachiatum]